MINEWKWFALVLSAVLFGALFIFSGSLFMGSERVRKDSLCTDFCLESDDIFLGREFGRASNGIQGYYCICKKKVGFLYFSSETDDYHVLEEIP